VHTCIDLIELAAGLSLPDEVHAAWPLPRASLPGAAS
jgi:hypothetical protein